MSDFATGAARLAGLIPRALGWKPDEFWNSTPAELAAVVTAGNAADAEPLSRTELNQLLEREGHG